MGDDDQRLFPVQMVDGIHDGSLRLVVQRGGGLIQHQHLRILKQGPGDADPLALSAGDPDAPLPDAGVKPLRKAAHEFVQLGFLQRLPHLFIVDLLIRHAEGHIFADGGIDHEDGLGNVADIFQPPLIMLPDLHAVRQDLPLLDMKKAEKDIDDGGLSRAGGADHAHGASHRDGHLRVVKDQYVAVRVMIDDILQLDPFTDRKLLHLFFLQIGLRVVVHAVVVDLLLQIVAHAHEKGLEIGNGGQIIVDPVGAGQKPHGRHREHADLGDHVRHVPPRQDLQDQIQHQPRDADRLDQKPRGGVVDVVLLHRAHIACPAFGVFVDEIALPVGDLDLLDSHHRLIDPFVQAAVIILIFLAGLFHDGLEDVLDDKKDRHKQGRDHQRHQRILHHQHRGQDHKHDDLAGQLQTGQDQAVHVVHVRGDAPLDHGGVRVQIIFIGPLHEIDHHPAGGGELIGIDKAQLHHVLKIQEYIFQHKGRDDRREHQNGELGGALQPQKAVYLPQITVSRHLLRVQKRLDHRYDQADAAGLQKGADEHQHDDPAHFRLLPAVQQDVHFLQYLLHETLQSFRTPPLFIFRSARSVYGSPALRTGP